MESIRSISLVSPVAAGVIYVLAASLALAALGRPNRRALWAGCATLIVVLAAVVYLAVWPKPFPDAIPWTIYACGAAAVFVFASAALQPGRRLALATAGVPALACAYLAANLVYQQYPTVGSLKPVPVTAPLTLAQFSAAVAPPTLNGREVGALVTVPAPPLRDAVAFVPPAYWRGETLPVLVLLSGSPGKPVDWFTDGQAAQALDDFQAAHDGRAPLVVSVDPLGSETGNPACADGPDLKLQTYLGEEIPELMKDTFHVNKDQSTWTIGGLSYGGTCALQVITNNPRAYGSFLDFSGEPEPTVGDHRTTVDEIFGGSEEAFQAANPETLLRQAAGTDTYRGIAGRFIAGDDDAMSTAALPHLNDLARAAGMDTTYDTRPGGHSYAVWRAALRDTLDFVASRGGISGGTTGGS